MVQFVIPKSALTMKSVNANLISAVGVKMVNKQKVRFIHEMEIPAPNGTLTKEQIKEAFVKQINKAILMHNSPVDMFTCQIGSYLDVKIEKPDYAHLKCSKCGEIARFREYWTGDCEQRFTMVEGEPDYDISEPVDDVTYPQEIRCNNCDTIVWSVTPELVGTE
jgi:hypothetical protein